MSETLSDKGMEILRKALVGKQFTVTEGKAGFCMTIRMVTGNHAHHYTIRYQCGYVLPYIEMILIEKVRKFLAQYFNIRSTYFERS